VESEEVLPGVILDFNADGKVVGVGILDLSARIKSEQLKILQYETARAVSSDASPLSETGKHQYME
jgi:uncharacterized protein YuzE